MKRIPQRSTIVCGKTGQGKTVFVKSEIEQIVKETNTKVVVCISGSSNYEEICNDLKGQCTTIADLEDVIFADDVQLQIFKITETIEKTPVIQRIEEIVNSIWDKNSRLYVDELRIDTLQLLKVCKRNEIQCTITEQRLTQEMKSAFDEVIILAPLGKHGENTTLIQE